MASFLRRPIRLTATLSTGSAMGFYAYTKLSKPHIMDSQANMTTTYSFPKTMLFSRELTVTSVETINHDTKRLTFALPGGRNELSGMPNSSAILTQHWPKGGLLPCLRPYTPVHDRSEPGILQLVVKRYENGTASTYMHSLRPGDKLTTRGPIPGGYSWSASSTPRDVLFIAGGAGITPLYSLAHGALADPNDKTRIHLVWGVNGPRDIVLKRELDELQAAHPHRLRVTYAVSGPEAQLDMPRSRSDDDRAYKNGHVKKDMLQEFVGSFEAGAFGDQKGTKVFLCGPPKMEDTIAGKQGSLEQLGVTKKMIHRF